MALTFAGVDKIVPVGGGMIKVFWSAATGGTVGTYNIYVRNGNSSVFSSTYEYIRVDSGVTSMLLLTEADGTTFFQAGSTYHIGVRVTESGGSEDSNVVVKSAEPYGDQSTYTEAPDRKQVLVI